MNPATSHEARHGSHESTTAGSCQDGFRYKVVDQDGRYRFMSVQATSGVPCAGDTLALLIAELSGAWLDEVDVERLKAFPCGKESTCALELAKMVQELKDLLL